MLAAVDRFAVAAAGVVTCVKHIKTRREVKYGGARRDRTDDLLLAKQALSQLSYGPESRPPETGETNWLGTRVHMVGRGGLEPPTSRLSGVRSNHLSYRPSPASGQVWFQACSRRASWARLTRHTLTKRGATNEGRETKTAQMTAIVFWGRSVREHQSTPIIYGTFQSQQADNPEHP